MDNFEKAKNKPVTQETIEKQLKKTGGTPFYIDNIRFNNMPNDIFIPIREINQIRREILDNATELLLNHYTPTKKAVKEVRKNLTKFIDDYENTILTYKSKVSNNVSAIVIHPDALSRLQFLRNFIN